MTQEAVYSLRTMQIKKKTFTPLSKFGGQCCPSVKNGKLAVKRTLCLITETRHLSLSGSLELRFTGIADGFRGGGGAEKDDTAPEFQASSIPRHHMR